MSSQNTNKVAQPDVLSEEQMRIEAIGDQLRTKISSKFQSAALLGGFLFTILSIQISMLWEPAARPFLLPVSLALMLAAIFLYICAVIKLDELTMPKRFWQENPSAPGPRQAGLLTQNDLWELRNRMVYYWSSLVLVATALAALSLAGMIIPLQAQVSPGTLQTQAVLASITILSLAAVYLGVLASMAARKFRPLMRPMD